METCKLCEKPEHARGLCEHHYTLFAPRIGRPVTWAWLQRVGLCTAKDDKLCQVAGCVSLHYAKNWCHKHYMQNRNKVRKNLCKLEGCESQAIAFTKYSDGRPLPEEVIGLCVQHCNEWFQQRQD